jgi:hypothetical protein
MGDPELNTLLDQSTNDWLHIASAGQDAVSIEA